MSNEATKTQACLARIKARYPRAFVWKFNLRIGAGLPDAIVILDGAVIWLEFKDLKRGTDKELASAVRPLQRLTIRMMQRAGAEVWIVAFTPRGERIYDPATMNLAPWATVMDLLEERTK